MRKVLCVQRGATHSEPGAAHRKKGAWRRVPCAHGAAHRERCAWCKVPCAVPASGQQLASAVPVAEGMKCIQRAAWDPSDAW